LGFIMNIIGHLKRIFYSGNKKKLIENLLIVIIIAVIAIIAGGSLIDREKDVPEEKKEINEGRIHPQMEINSYTEGDELEKKLELILEQISGAGKVKVMVTYVSGREIVPAYDTRESINDTSEMDNNGGHRDIKQKDYESSIAYTEEQGGNKKPVVLKDLKPVVKGVVVVCDGAGNPAVKDNITKAVKALTDVPIHKIQVFKREK
jgi:stage III sporulation protein AG